MLIDRGPLIGGPEKSYDIWSLPTRLPWPRRLRQAAPGLQAIAADVKGEAAVVQEEPRGYS